MPNTPILEIIHFTLIVSNHRAQKEESGGIQIEVSRPRMRSRAADGRGESIDGGGRGDRAVRERPRSSRVLALAVVLIGAKCQCVSWKHSTIIMKNQISSLSKSLSLLGIA